MLLLDEAHRPLIVQNSWNDAWTLPGGALAHDEPPRRGAQREIAEELGLDIHVGRLLVVDWEPPTETLPIDGLMSLFDGGQLDNTQIANIRLQESEIRAHRFVTPDELPAGLPANLERRLRAALTAKEHGTTLYLEDGHPVAEYATHLTQVICAHTICVHTIGRRPMWTTECSSDSSASPNRLFAILADTAAWPEWNAGVARIDMDGSFAAGTTATMVFPDQSSLPFRLIAVDPGRGFEDETPVPDAGVVVRVQHELAPRDGGGTRITYRCTVDGPDEVGAEIGPAVSADFPEVIAALAALAERTE